MSSLPVTVVGGGLAGCEAAFRLAESGVPVRLVEMRPGRRSPAHRGDGLAELVCSNSLRSDDPSNAVGLLHAELRRLGSLVLRVADGSRVPAGDALAVDRALFSARVTEEIARHPRIELVREEAADLPPGPSLGIVASGPLTSDALAAGIARVAGAGLSFYDAIAPIIADESIDHSVAFRASRWGKGGGDDYLNLPLDRPGYEAFVDDLLSAEKVAPRAFEEPRYFDGCLPIEVMAERGRRCLAFGPMKPVGLTDPRTGRRPYAVVQLRAEDAARSAWNLVGFQTRLTWPEQRRVFGRLPGLSGATYLRLGQVHRNTFLDAPRLLAEDLSLRSLPHLFFAGQITGVEGYVESAACGWLAARFVEARLGVRPFKPPPPGTALGALHGHLLGRSGAPGRPFQPSNVTFALFAPLDEPFKKSERRQRLVLRAQREFSAWADLLEPQPASTGPSHASSGDLP